LRNGDGAAAPGAGENQIACGRAAAGYGEEMAVAVGIVLVVVGAAFAVWGVYRLSRPRRREDVEWIRSNPLSNLTLGGLPLGFDRSGAVFSVVAGVAGILLGLGVMLA
jgi:hypothetical protein